MDNISISRRYAEAIYNVAEEKDEVFEVFEMLNVILEHIEHDDDFKKFLSYPIITKEEKKDLVNRIYKDIKNGPLEILDYLIEKDRLLHIKEINEQYSKIYYEAHKKLIVTAIFPKELSFDQKEKLRKKLVKMKQKEVVIHYKVDKDLIGGGIIKINDDVIDGSIKTQIKELKR
ncbi:ATP synthase F1 subunit delta [Streptobacillus felis]|uniref:ATP synthase subunit delta n=1 Tax=Streptobacillus felis TaxID=1384509 RepID=A0A7Z0PFA1_9FUSO|nr:ATP synthase F1 subunit delta [Streptobacillus felis]NYV27974.1 ATP synthase F1 subunit delta [Streptobacillus felis]